MDGMGPAGGASGGGRREGDGGGSRERRKESLAGDPSRRPSEPDRRHFPTSETAPPHPQLPISQGAATYPTRPDVPKPTNNQRPTVGPTINVDDPGIEWLQVNS